MIYPGTALLWFCLIASGGLLLIAFLLTPWRAFLAVRDRSLMWLGYWLVVSFVWLLKIPLAGILAMHLTVLTAAVFIFGWALTLLIGALALLAGQLLQPLPWYTLPVNFWLGVAMPVAASWLVQQFIARVPVNNLFMFILGGGFAGSIFTVFVTLLASLFWYWLFSLDSLLVTLSDHAWLYVMSIFPEGFIGGAVLSTVTVLKPDLVKSYDDDRYLSD